ncbi:hypothetical protein T492DRAFT_12588 [Pavlovales sp. CCMP2436]|nr:hypothetical protein T492DRAFT_12588 [Pavlovales sp. CCMP2436]
MSRSNFCSASLPMPFTCALPCHTLCHTVALCDRCAVSSKRRWPPGRRRAARRSGARTHTSRPATRAAVRAPLGSAAGGSDASVCGCERFSSVRAIACCGSTPSSTHLLRAATAPPNSHSCAPRVGCARARSRPAGPTRAGQRGRARAPRRPRRRRNARGSCARRVRRARSKATSSPTSRRVRATQPTPRASRRLRPGAAARGPWQACEGTSRQRSATPPTCCGRRRASTSCSRARAAGRPRARRRCRQRPPLICTAGPYGGAAAHPLLRPRSTTAPAAPKTARSGS